MSREVIIGRVFKPNYSLVDYAKYYAPTSWEKLFKNESLQKQLEYAQKGIGNNYYPRKIDVFRAFELTPLDKVKVIIIGQDPYPDDFELDGVKVPTAMGMCFSVPEGKPINSSLKNIFKEIKRSTDFRCTKGDLTSWATQGVLMLNMALTTVPHNFEGKHIKYWRCFIRLVLQEVTRANPNVITVLWGRKAQDFVDKSSLIKLANLPLRAAHPSGMNTAGGFIGCNHFVEINRMLEESGQDQIDFST